MGLRRGSAQALIAGTQIPLEPSHSPWAHATTKPSCLILLHTLLPRGEMGGHEEAGMLVFSCITSSDEQQPAF